MRRIIYIWEFIRNIFKYFNKPVKMDKLQVWVGQACTLRCKNCSQLFPYIENKIYDINEVIEDLKIALNFIEPESIHIIGGETFTNKNFDKLIDFVCEVNPNKPNKLITNGTIIPQEKIIQSLAKNFENISVTISKYPIIEDKQKKFYETLRGCQH